MDPASDNRGEHPALGPSDALRLLDRVRRGDERAFAALVELFWGPLVRYALTFVDERDGAEDLAQHALIRLWERRGRWEAGSEPGVLLYRMVRNRGLNVRARRATRRSKASEVRRVWTRAPESPLQSALSRETAEIVRRAVDALPPQRRDAVILARFHGMSRSEVAEVMGLAPQTVANHLTLALSQLRTILGDQR